MPNITKDEFEGYMMRAFKAGQRYGEDVFKGEDQYYEFEKTEDNFPTWYEKFLNGEKDE